MNSPIVVMSNELIRASAPLSLNELRVIFIALSQMPKSDEQLDPNHAYYITKEDFVKIGVQPNNVAREIKSACNDLLNRVVKIPLPNMGTLRVHWLLSVLSFKEELYENLKNKYPESKNDEKFINTLRLHNLLEVIPMIANSDDNIVARIVFHPNMMPYISELRKNFTWTYLFEVLSLNSTYSIRIFLMMMQFKETGLCKIHLDDFRYALDLDDKYQLFADLLKRVIEPSIQNINEYSGYEVKYNLIKKGRKYTFLELRFKKKKLEKEQLKCPDTIDMFEEPKDIFIKLSDAQLNIFSSKLSDLVEVQKMADAGEEMKPFIARLRSMLENPEKQKKLLPYLNQIGFKSYKS